MKAHPFLLTEAASRRAARALGISLCQDCGAWTTGIRWSRCSACFRRLGESLRQLRAEGLPLRRAALVELAREGRRWISTDSCLACRKPLPSPGEHPSPLCDRCDGAFWLSVSRGAWNDRQGAARALRSALLHLAFHPRR